MANRNDRRKAVKQMNRKNKMNEAKRVAKKAENKSDLSRCAEKVENKVGSIGKSTRYSDINRARRNNKDKNKSEDRNYTPRIKSKCPISNKCGGCQYIDTPYEEQIAKKQARIEELLGEFGEIEPIVGMENPYHYRNKVHAVVHRMQNGRIYSGVYEEHTHNVLPMNSCFIENEKADQIIATITGLLKSFKLTVYNETSGYGLIRHILVRVGHNSGEIMVVIVTAYAMFPSKNNFAKALLKEYPEITTIVQNINDKDTSMVLGSRDQVIYGKGYIEDTLCGMIFRISPQSFYHINSVQTEILYNKAMKYADFKNKETVIDAYCGIGTIGIVASRRCKEVIGVELNTDAVKDANTNAKLNDIHNISFYNNDAGRFMVGMANEGKKVDIVFMDPPRSGSDEAFMSSVLKLAPKKIVYVSCGPESLVKDLKYLTKDKMYEVRRMGAVDMFPMTYHVETVVLMSRVDK